MRWTLALALLVAACGEDAPGRRPDETSTSTATTPTVATPTTPVTTPTETTQPLITALVAAPHVDYGSLISVTWEQAATADVHVEYSFDADVWVSSPTVTREAGPQQQYLVGVPYGMLVTWRLVADDGVAPYTSGDAVVETRPLPDGVPPALVTLSDPALQDATSPYWLVGLGVVSWSTDPWWEVIIDRQGRVVWADRAPINRSSMHSRVARDGKSLYIDQNSAWPAFDGGANSTIDEILLDGTLLNHYATVGLHHPFTDMPDHSIAYGMEYDGGELLRILHTDGTTEDVWDCEDWLQSIGVNDTCASNTLNYDEATDKFLFSFYSLESIIEIDRTTGLVDRWFGQIDGSYRFDPPTSEFFWQHGGYITDTGTLLTSSHNAASTETIVREYTIDDTYRSLTQVWAFGIGDGIYGDVMGEAVRLPNGNTLHNTGSAPRLREATVDGTVVWDVQWDIGGLGRSMPIADLNDLLR